MKHYTVAYIKKTHPQVQKSSASTSIVAFLVLFLLSSSVSATLYRWVDDDGKVHYSDSVPPSKAQKGHTEMDSLGNEVKKVGAAKTEKQVAEEKRLRDIENARIAKIELQQRKDLQLLRTYSNIEQFDKFYAERLNMLGGEREQLELLHDKLTKELEGLLGQYNASEDKAEKKEVQEFIDMNMKNARIYREAIEHSTTEEEGIRSEIEQLRERFLKLKKQRAKAGKS